MTPIGASRGAILALSGLSFFLGGVAGALAEHRIDCRAPREVAPHRGKSWADDQVERISKALALNPKQKALLVQTMAEMKPRYQKVYGSVHRSRRAIDRELSGQLAPALEAKQRDALESLMATDEQRRRAYIGIPVAPETEPDPAPHGDTPEAEERAEPVDKPPTPPVHDTTRHNPTLDN